MSFAPLTVIEASAGTGKTFALVTRLLRLIFAGTPPERIVALTFSRMAAGEIFNSFIERLAKAALDEAGAAAESEHLGRSCSAAEFRAMLRRVIASQHLSLIGTLDSFLMRIVRMIPQELGLPVEISIMSDYQSPVERLHLVGEMMLRESPRAKEIFRESFRLAYGTTGAKRFLDAFSEMIESWHARYRDWPDAGAWGNAAAIWGGNVPTGLDVTLGEVRACADALAPFAERRGAAKFIEAVRTFSGALPDTFPKALADEPAAQRAIRAMFRWNLAQSLKRTQGIYLLMDAYERAYAEKVRARGRITFDDLPRLVNALGPSTRLPLEYRLDATFDHWALDEFQDTSRGQWRALENLIDESLQRGADKSVFIVGDRKQSIYDWRGGDVRILSEQAARAEEMGVPLVSLDESYRYRPAISSAVNALFGEDVIRGLFDMDHTAEGAVWRCRPHRSHDASEQGFVEVIQAEKAGNVARVSDFFAPIENALKAVRPWERNVTTAILVRKNATGEKILAHLKEHGISRVVFEGESDVFDSPVLGTMADLVQLAEHPNDAFAYAHIVRSPLAPALWPEGAPKPNAMAAELLARFTRLGLARTFRDVREALKAVSESWNEFTESRFEDFLKCAAEFDELRDATMRLSDFIEYLRHRKRRDYAEPGVVRILTMHQSKGLGFDWVIVPFYEHEGLVDDTHAEPLEGETPPWILDSPGAAVAADDSVLASALKRGRDQQRYDALCLDYVALTRAKRALTIILHPANKTLPKEPQRFSDLVRTVGLKTQGDREWYLKTGVHICSEPKPHATSYGSEQNMHARLPPRRRRETLHKSRPSETYYTGLTGDRLFAADFGAAAERGQALHEKYAQIEWSESGVLARPSPDATLWRERPYELFLDGEWQTGRFDRVVFTGTGSERRATIYDFKTNTPRAGEFRADFTARMTRTYAPQLAAYRKALAALTGLADDHIATELILI